MGLSIRQGSSKAMESYGLSKLFQELKDFGMKIAYHIQDGDSSSEKTIKVIQTYLKNILI